jgi:hypothetical protein
MGSLDLLLTFLWSFVFGKGRCIWILWIGFWYPPFLVLLWFLVLFHLVWAPFLRFASGLSLILFFLVLFLVLGLVLEHSPLFLVLLRLDFVQEVGNQWLFPFATPLMDSVFLSYGSWVLV